jgi:hypothetical protein
MLDWAANNMSLVDRSPPAPVAAMPGGPKVFERQLEDVIAFFDLRRTRLRRLDVRLFIAQAVFTILTTVLVGLQLAGHETTLRNLALISSLHHRLLEAECIIFQASVFSKLGACSAGSGPVTGSAG